MSTLPLSSAASLFRHDGVGVSISLTTTAIATLNELGAATTTTSAISVVATGATSVSTTTTTISAQPSSFTQFPDGFRNLATEYTILGTTVSNGTYTNTTIATAIEGHGFAHLLAEVSWQKACLLAFFTTLIVVTVLGNTLVILSVITDKTRSLRTVTNCFVMSLAVADWLVGVFVMPPSVLLYLYGSWNVGWVLCDIWISLDILLCTASILSLCAISLDRYRAVTQPLSYKKRRTKRLALYMIFMVWILALAITCPPILGWYEPDRRKASVECRYNQNKGYVVFSAMGSFFIPMSVMLYVYARICWLLASRRSRMTHTEASERNVPDGIELDHVTSECESGVHQPSPAGRSYSMRKQQQHQQQQQQQQHHHHHHHHHHRTIIHKKTSLESPDSRHTLYELVEISKSSSTIRTSSTITNYKISSTATGVPSGPLAHQATPYKPLHCCQQQQQQQQQQICGTHPSSALSESAECLSASKLQRNCHLQRQHSTMSGIAMRATGHNQMLRVWTSKRESKATKTLSIVVGGFIACWLPFFVYYLLIPFLPRDKVSEVAMTVLTWLGWVNSAINPFIYAFYNTDFRDAFWRLTFSKLCKGSPNRNMLH